MRKRNMSSMTIAGLLAATMFGATALPAAAGTGPRSDMRAGSFALGFDPGAVSVDLGLTNRLTVGVDARDSYAGPAWSGIGARATYRLLGKADGWNLGIGGRLSVPSSHYDALVESRVRDIASSYQAMGAASAYLILSMPLTPWFIMRYPIGMTYYVGPNQNGGQAWTFGSSNWSPDDDRTAQIDTGTQTVYFPILQLLPETAFKLWGFEATLFGGSIAGMRLTF